MRIRMPVGEAFARWERGEVTMLDQLSTSQDLAATEKIESAIRMPANELPDRLGELSRERDVVSYCTCPHDELSARAVLFLRKEGFKAWALEGGLEAWIEAGHPTEKRKG